MEIKEVGAVLKRKNRRNNKKRKLNKQKIFSFISFIFITVCIFWYGGRAIYFYLDSKKTLEKENTTLARNLINNNINSNNFKKINSTFYFQKDANNNYLMYSNILWRIIKITKDNTIVLIANDSITNLAFGNNKKYKNSYLLKWMNTDEDKYTGILENNLNNPNTYLTKTETCTDNISNIKKITCNKINKNNYLSLLSITDYINTGAEKSFINNGKYTYLSNNKNKKVWYIDEEGKLNSNNGEEIYGVKPIITLKKKTTTISGDGTEKNPYIIEKETSKFGSYVKLDEDIWRVYNEDDTYIKLSLNDYIKVNDENLEYKYSNTNFYHNDTTYGSLAYYLNHTYLYGLSYNDLIINSKYSNSYYGEDNNYDYSSILNTTIDTKVGLLSIADPIINNNLDNYFILAGPGKESEEVYIVSKNSTVDSTYATDEANIVPTITIKKDILEKGSGTINDPYRTE